MKYNAWNKSNKIQADFEKALNKIRRYLLRIANTSDINEFINNMNKFQNSDLFKRLVYTSVKNMVTPLAIMNMKTWRKAAKKATKNPLTYRLLLKELDQGLGSDIDRMVLENSRLISTLPSDVAEKVNKNISKLTFEGKRSSQIAKEIMKYTNQHAKASAKLIARTETGKTMEALTRSRSENLGINWYVWRTAEDGDRVRPSHRNMNGVLVRYDDPPSPEKLIGESSVGKYNAGGIWNCRCYAEPLIDIDDVKWPCRVYSNGNIKSMHKKEFEVII